ncbi:MAG: hypothetical protein WAW80_03035 [Candidatus Saccharimonadales bacterium]
MALTNSTTTFADNATWSGDSISYNNETYTKIADALPGIGSDRDAYAAPAKDGKANVISVSKNVDKTKEITDAKQYVYNYDDQTNVYSSAGPPSDVTVSAQSGDGSGDGEKTSCGVPSIGWILCGTSRFLAGAMDKVYDWINNFLVIKPLTTDTDSGLFQAWDIARGIANACFIIAFLIIVYSQITSVGISNYEIKKMIPRLIIAAVLVNVSYYICTIAVDVSNILGDSVQKALVEIRESLPAPKAQTSWGGLTNAVLSGVAVAGTAYLASAEIIALVPLLIPILFGGILSLLVALIVLAARQALITVLVVLAPLAFVAYLLPNTEKQFERWRGLFMNMLMIFPLFSLLFGGSQLASYLIIQNTDQISVVILAMAVQVAPLAITPFLLRVSNNLLTQLGGMMNNPKKGLVDRSRNFANEHSQIMRNKMNERGANKGMFTPTGMAYRRARGGLYRERKLKNSQDRMAAAVANEERMIKLGADSKVTDLQKNVGDAKAELQFEERKASATNDAKVLQNDSGTLRTTQLQAHALQKADDARWQEALSSTMDPRSGERYASFTTVAQSALLQEHIADGSKEAAEGVVSREYVQHLNDNEDVRIKVGGIDPNGAQRALARAKQQDYENKAKIVKQIEDAADIMPGRTPEMATELLNAIEAGDAERARAHINLLAASNDPGVIALREILRDNEARMQQTGILESIKYHVNFHQSLNNDAEDLVRWSRGDNTLATVTSDAGTWSNQTAQKLISQKQSSQVAAFDSGGVKKSTMRDMLTSTSAAGLKPTVKTRLRAELKIRDDGSEDASLTDKAFWDSLQNRTQQPPSP